MAAPRTGNKSLKDYLKKYESSDVIEKKKKKQKKPSKPEAKGVLVVDEDPVWQKQIDPEVEDNEDDSAEEMPLVDEDIEVKRMRGLEEIKARRAHNAIAEDGSGWVTLPPNREDTISDISPPRRQRTRNDSPSPEPGPRHSVADRVETDMSPPRRRKRHYSPSPEPNVRHAKPVSLDSDMSLPRKRKSRNDSPSPDPEDKVFNSICGICCNMWLVSVWWIPLFSCQLLKSHLVHQSSKGPVEFLNLSINEISPETCVTGVDLLMDRKCRNSLG